jgi:hypothetical protein
VFADGRGVGDAAVRLHHEWRGESDLLGALDKSAEVGVDFRRHVGVHDRRRGALVLPERREEFVGGRDRRVQLLAQDSGDGLLVAGVGVGVEQRDRDALGVGLTDSVREVAHVLRVGNAVDSLGGRALLDLEAAAARDQRVGLLGVQIVEVGAVLSADFQHVAESLGRDERGPRAVGLQQRVGRDRHRVREVVDGVGGEVGFSAGFPDAVEDALALVVGRGDLRGDEALVGGQQRNVGEGAAHVRADADSVGHGRQPPGEWWSRRSFMRFECRYTR